MTMSYDEVMSIYDQWDQEKAPLEEARSAIVHKLDENSAQRKEIDAKYKNKLGIELFRPPKDLVENAVRTSPINILLPAFEEAGYEVEIGTIGSLLKFKKDFEAKQLRYVTKYNWGTSGESISTDKWSVEISLFKDLRDVSYHFTDGELSKDIRYWSAFDDNWAHGGGYSALNGHFSKDEFTEAGVRKELENIEQTLQRIADGECQITVTPKDPFGQ